MMILVLLRLRNFNGYSEERRVIRFNEFLSLSEGKTVPGRFSIDSTKSFEGIELPHQKLGCLDCKNEVLFGDCDVKRKTSCFSCKMDRTFETCLEQISPKKTYSTDINMLKKT